MPSPFQGMDPFIESQVWPEFHSAFLVTLLEALVPLVRPRYFVRGELRVYVEHTPEDMPEFVWPDAVVLRMRRDLRPSVTATLEPPTHAEIIDLPIPEGSREFYLEIKDRESMELVAVIEALSPGNKRLGSDGRREYLEKRGAALQSASHLIELDLLRGGARLPTGRKPLPPGNYYAIVARARRRPSAEAYAWTIRDPLRTIPIPPANGDPDVRLDQHAVFTQVYDRAGYDYSLDYARPVEPPLSPEDEAWLRGILSKHKPAAG